MSVSLVGRSGCLDNGVFRAIGLSVLSYSGKAISIIRATFANVANAVLNIRILYLATAAFILAFFAVLYRAEARDRRPPPPLPASIEELRLDPRVEEAVLIENGSFGSVFSVKTRAGEQCAVKQFRAPPRMCSHGRDINPGSPLYILLRDRVMQQRVDQEMVIFRAVEDKERILGLQTGIVRFYEGVRWMQHSITLEFLGGGDLANEVGGYPEGYLPRDLALNYVTQIANALGFLHDPRGRGTIIHSDIKPENILLTADKTTVKVTDFGTSVVVEGPSEKVTRTVIVGTDSYMSPEYLRTKVSQVSDDWWGLGLIFKRCVTGVLMIFEVDDSGSIIPGTVKYQAKGSERGRVEVLSDVDPLFCKVSFVSSSPHEDKDLVFIREFSLSDIASRVTSYEKFRSLMARVAVKDIEWTEDVSRPYSMGYRRTSA